MTLTVTDSEDHSSATLPEGCTLYDVLLAIKQLSAHRQRSLKENRGERKNYYVPNGRPIGRPRKNPPAPEGPKRPVGRPRKNPPAPETPAE